MSDDADTGASNLFAARAARRSFVNVLTGAVFVSVLVSVWPTEPRKLDKRARAYLEAANRGDWARAYEYLAPDRRARQPRDAWVATRPPQPARRELVAVDVADGGETARVSFADGQGRSLGTTPWVRVGWDWYVDEP